MKTVDNSKTTKSRSNKLFVFDLEINTTGDWASSFHHHKYFKTRAKAEAYCRRYEREQHYYPVWRITPTHITIEE